jgi:RNA polymerase sigma-70 factor (ECF subfamily)
MSSAELIALIQSNSKTASKAAFDKYYSRLSSIASRYAKNQTQADDLFHHAFHACLNKLRWLKQPPLDLDEFVEKEFINEAISFIKSVRSEYYVSSTIYAPGENSNKNYDLFDTAEIIDYKQIDNEILIKSLQQLVPSQRLIFNLHVIDGFALTEAAAMLEASEGTVKSNLEKARFNLQKNIEKTLKSSKV